MAMMISNAGTPQPKPIEEKVKDAVGVIAGIAVILYAVGFTVASASLMSWGIVNQNLAKARYVSVGVLFTLHVMLIVLPVAFFSKKLHYRIYRRKIFPLFSFLASIFALIFLPIIISLGWLFATSTVYNLMSEGLPFSNFLSTYSLQLIWWYFILY